MASFCSQCSIDLFGEDYGDFKRRGKQRNKLKPGYFYLELCEDCGAALVNDNGICQGGCDNATHRRA